MKKIFCLLIIVAVMISMMPVGAYAATTTYYAGYVENMAVETEGVPSGFMTSKDNRQKVGSCYFYFDWEDTINIYCSKSKTGKAVNITKSTTSMRPGSTVIVGGNYVYYSITDYDKNQSKIYRIGKDGKGRKLIKTLKGVNGISLLRVYNESLYFFGSTEGGFAYVNNLYKISLSASKPTSKKLMSNVEYDWKHNDNLPSTSKTRYLYLTNGAKNEAYVFDCKTNKKIKTISVGGEIGGMGVTGDRLYVFEMFEGAEDTLEPNIQRMLNLYSFSKTGKDKKTEKVVDNVPYSFGEVLVKGKLVYPCDENDPDWDGESRFWIYDVAEKTEYQTVNEWSRYIQLYGN